MTEFDRFNSDDEPYRIPEDILEGDFRDLHAAGGDPVFTRAADFIREQVGEEAVQSNLDMVQQLYIEMGRSDAAFHTADRIDDFEQREKAYKTIEGLFGLRFQRIIHPEAFTDE
jgi:hypothetical protein